MDKAKLIKKLMATFVEELEEHVQAFNRDLLVLEKNPAPEERAERLKTLFRTAHSLKGAARSVNVSLIEGACHRLEEILSAARDGGLALDSPLFALFFGVADAIAEAGARLREEKNLGGAPLEALLPRLDAVALKVVRRLPTVESAPAAASVWSLGEAQPAKPNGARPSKAEIRFVELPASPAPTVDLAPAAMKPAAAPLAAASPPQTEPLADSSASGSVRVPAEKLDALLSSNGELLIARRRVASRLESLAGLRELVGRWKAEWRTHEKPLGKFVQQHVHGTETNGPREQGNGRQLPRRAAQLLERTGENFQRLEKDLERLLGAMAEDSRQLDQAADSLQEDVRRARMLPFAEACQGLDRMVRDLAQARGKQVELALQGNTVELDRSILEGLKDPLRHLVRNAVDHGAETPSQRQAAGKAPSSRISVSAALRGSQVEIVVADDGRGLDLDALREQVRKKRLPEPGDDRELSRVVFHPGLSTSPIITDISGRGVGLDVVKSRVESLHGTVDLSWQAGQGTRFTLIVPLTLTTLRALLVSAGGQVLAFAGTNVQRLVRASASDLRSVAGRPVLSLGGASWPWASLSEVLGLPAREPARPSDKTPVLLVAAGDQRMAFAVDEFLAEQEIVVKSLGARVRRARNVSGATILPSGRIALVLNAAYLVRHALSQGPVRKLAAATGGATVQPKKRLLVVDDSVTTRILEKSILEAAGYEVSVAADGEAAWRLLQERGADLVVSDVDMPRMDGFVLTQLIRGAEGFQKLPVILVTARDTDQDKARGIEVGADAYLVKSAFDQRNLLETITQLL